MQASPNEPAAYNVFNRHWKQNSSFKRGVKPTLIWNQTRTDIEICSKNKLNCGQNT